jgi:predicted metal-dependent hydrolase
MQIQIIKKDVKNINIKIKPNCEVILTAPTKTTNEHITNILKKRADWIDKKIAFFQNHKQPKAKEYVSGENFTYLGRNYRLKVVESQEESAKLQRGYLTLSVNDKSDYQRKKRLIQKWYNQKAKQHFEKALKKYQPIVNKEIKSLKIREMKTRWGSCNALKSYINLNSILITKPTYCIEYVVFHELAHLIHPNHSKRFYNYLSTHMPDWQMRKKRLDFSN